MRSFRDFSLCEWVMVVLVTGFAFYVAWTGPYGLKIYRASDEPATVAPAAK
jgi:hypothetical protein